MADGRIPFGQGVPNRGTSEYWLDDWNKQFRQSSLYRNFMQRNGLPTDGRAGGLSRQQQSALENELRAAGMEIPSGMHIDQGGNLNQKNTLVRNSLITAGAAGGALTGFGLAGMGPFSGLGGGAASGAAGASGSLAPVTGGAPWAVTPYAGTAMSVPTGAAAVGGSVGGATAGINALSSAGAGSGIPGYVPGFEGNSNLLFSGSGAGAGAATAAGSAATDIPGFTPGWEGNTDIVGAGIDAATDGARRYAGLTRDQWLKLATAVGTRAAGSFGGDRSDYSPDATSNDPNMRRLLETMQGRLDKSEPLYDSVMAMADGLLPTRYQRGGGGR